MPKRSSKAPKGDLNTTAFDIVRQATEQGERVSKMIEGHAKEKNPAAVALGRLGGLKGGKARAKKLTASKRSDIAKRAALKRWSQKP